MKLLLGTSLAVLLLAAPAFAAPGDQSPATTQQQSGQSGDDQDATAAPQGRRDHQGARRHGRYFNHQWVRGERVPPRFLAGRRVVTDYARFRVEAPSGGDQWLKARRMLLLVDSDGVVKTVIARQHRRRAAQDDSQQPQQ